MAIAIVGLFTALLIKSSSWTVIGDFRVTAATLSVDERLLADLVRAEVLEIIALHASRGEPLDPRDALEKVLRPESTRGLWNQHDSPARELVGLELGTAAVRTIDLTNLGEVKVGTFTLPLEVIWSALQQMFGWGPTVVSGQLGLVEGQLRLSAEIRPATSVRAHVASRPGTVNVQPLANDVAYWVVHAVFAQESGTSLEGFREITRGLRALRDYETTLSRLALREAAQHFDGAIARDPRVPTAYYNRGIVADLLGQRTLALEMYTAAANRHPKLHAARLRRGLLLAKARRYNEALEVFRDLQAAPDPYGRLAQLYLADLAVVGERFHEAVPLWTAIAQWPLDGGTPARGLREKIERRRHNDERRSQRVAAAVRAVDLEMSPWALLDVGERYEALDAHQTAAAAFEGAARAGTGDLAMIARALMARARFLAKDFVAAREAYDQLARDAEDDVRRLAAPADASLALALDYWRGRIALEAGDAKRARRFLERYISAHPQDRGVLFDLGRVAFELEDSPEAAAQIFSRITRDDGELQYLNAQENVAWLYAQMGHLCAASTIMNRIVDASRHIVDEGIAARRHGRLAQFLVGASQDATRAAAAASRALTHDRGDAGAYNALAMVALDRADPAAVHRFLRRAWEFGTEDERGLALVIAAEVQWRAGHEAAAEALLRDSRALRNRDATAYLLFSIVAKDWRQPVRIAEATRHVYGADLRKRLAERMGAPHTLSRVTGPIRQTLCIDCPCGGRR